MQQNIPQSTKEAKHTSQRYNESQKENSRRNKTISIRKANR